MTHLVVYEYSEDLGKPAPAYAICVTEKAAFAEAMQPEWAAAARRIERVLNARYFGRSAPARGAVALRPDGEGSAVEFPER